MSDADEFTITLSIDGMYYQEAKRLRELATGKNKEYVEKLSRVSTTEENLLNKMNDPSQGIDSINEDDVDAFSLEMHDNYRPLQLAAAALYSWPPTPIGQSLSPWALASRAGIERIASAALAIRSFPPC